MRGFQGQKKKNKFLYSIPAIFLLLVICAIFGIRILTEFHKMQNTAHNKEIAKEKLIFLEDRKAKLLEDIDNLSNSKGREKILRQDYGYALPGEGVIVIIDKKEETSEIEENRGFWTKIKSFFSF